MSTLDFFRYQRQLKLEDFGVLAQERLHHARVLIIGVGGLGCPAAIYLTAAGVGTIGLSDGDRVELTNLHRQVLFDESDIGHSKAQVAQSKLSQKNSQVHIVAHDEWLTTENAATVIVDYDVVLDCSDNLPTRYLISDVCRLLGKPLVYGALHRYQGQLAVFNVSNSGNPAVTYRCLFPESVENSVIPSCNDAGVLGVLPGTIGTLQANEVIKLITGNGDVLIGKLWVIDLRTLETDTITLSFDPESNAAAPQDLFQLRLKHYALPCLSVAPVSEMTLNQVGGRNWIVVDVREEYEGPVPDINAVPVVRLPFDELRKRRTLLPPDAKLLVACQSGLRSKVAARILKEELGYEEVFSLKGGWNAIDS
jgi:adenylyltransferase/sulfurtransferase